ncbi:MAG: methyltransferase type 11 [Gammaproteobacteria bacterium]|nr:MAG: methyltransferase type 11 [Gammaproteobacteria bacterium]
MTETIQLGLIDLRSSEEFIKQHLKASCSLPWERLAKSMHELPANHKAISLLGEAEQLQQAEIFLSSKGYTITQCILANEEFWRVMSLNNKVESGCHTVALWQANPLLREVIELVETNVAGRQAIDLACGAGRDSVYLAKRGWQVTALDYKQDALERCNQLASLSQTSLTTLHKDLENGTNPLKGIKADLVLVMRYLHRPLFGAIDQLIKPGGALVYSTFMDGCEKFGSPKNPNYLLKPGELAEAFPAYKILLDETRKLADGRPVALFVATKP